jgi:hypothetical protein
VLRPRKDASPVGPVTVDRHATSVARTTPVTTTTTPRKNHRTVAAYRTGSSSSTSSDRYSAKSCTKIPAATTQAATAPLHVHSPGFSKFQNRTNDSENPRKTVIAVMRPCR